MRWLIAGSLACLFVVSACAGAGDTFVDEATVSPDLDAKADSATELGVRAGDTSLWVSKTITRREGANGA